MSFANDYMERDVFAADAAESERAAFIRKTYMHLAGAILAFMGLTAAFLNVPAIRDPLINLVVGGQWWLIFVAFMAVSWIADRWAQSGASASTQYMGLALYTIAEAVIFVPLLFFAQMQIGPNAIMEAAGMTLLIFGGLTIFVFMTGADFSFLRGILVVGSLAAFGCILLSLFGFFSLGIVFITAMIVLMCGFILYDTSNVLHHYRTDQHVAAALALFASIATLFWYVLQFYMASDD